MDESRCKLHDRVYTHYCNECDKVFCDVCPTHSKNHIIESLANVLNTEDLALDLKKLNKIYYSAEESLRRIPEATEKLIELARERKKVITEKYKVLAGRIARKNITSLINLETEIRIKTKGLEKVAKECKEIEVGLVDKEKTLKNINEKVKVKFNLDFSDAYYTIKEYKAITLMDDSEEKIKLLNERVNSIMMESVETGEIEQLKVFVDEIQSLRQELLNLNKKIQDIQSNYIEEFKRCVEIIKIRSDDIIKENDRGKIEKTKKYKEVSKELDELMKERDEVNNMLMKSKRQIEDLRDQRASLIKDIQDKKLELENIDMEIHKAELNKNNINATIEKRTIALSVIENNIKKINKRYLDKDVEGIVRQIIAQKKEIEEVEEEVKKTLSNSVEDINKKYDDIELYKSKAVEEAKELIEYAKIMTKTNTDIKKLNDFFEQIERQTMAMKAAKSKFDSIRNLINTQRMKKKNLKKLIYTKKVVIDLLTSNFNSVEDQMKQSILDEKVEEIHGFHRKLMEIESLIDSAEEKDEVRLINIDRTEGEFNRVIEQNIENLKLAKASLEEDTRTVCPVCTDGRSGKVKLKCGHCMCVPCVSKQKTDKVTDKNNTVYCIPCKWKKQEISNS